jgi:hypothetical protein
VTGAGAGGYLTVYPENSSRPASSTLNFQAGRTVANTVLASFGPDEEVNFYNGSGKSIDLVLDRLGVDPSRQAGNLSVGGTYAPVGPTRLLDTRSGTGAPKGAVPGGGTADFTAAGAHGVPADATAVVLDVAATNTKAAGHLSAYGHGTAFPGTSTVSWTTGQTVSNLAVVPLTDGKVALRNGSTASADFVADVVGYYVDKGTHAVLVPLTQSRVLDTRDGTGRSGQIARIGARQTVKLKIAGLAGVPATGVAAAELNLTVPNQTKNGYITAYPDGTARPTASSLNFRAGQTVAGAAVTPVGADGTVDLYNGSDAPIDLVADLAGFYYAYSGLG